MHSPLTWVSEVWSPLRKLSVAASSVAYVQDATMLRRICGEGLRDKLSITVNCPIVTVGLAIIGGNIPPRGTVLDGRLTLDSQRRCCFPFRMAASTKVAALHVQNA
jgi:hypothetical protein